MSLNEKQEQLKRGQFRTAEFTDSDSKCPSMRSKNNLSVVSLELLSLLILILNYGVSDLKNFSERKKRN